MDHGKLHETGNKQRFVKFDQQSCCFCLFVFFTYNIVAPTVELRTVFVLFDDSPNFT